MKSRIILCAALGVGLTVAAQPADAAPLIGYVNLQKAIFRVDQGAAARKKLENKLQQKQKELASNKGTIENIMRKLADPKVSAKERTELNKKRMEVQELFMKEQQALQKLEQEMFGPIMERMRKIIRAMGKKGGYEVILEINENRLLYGQDHLDLTNEVIRKYNSAHPKKGRSKKG